MAAAGDRGHLHEGVVFLQVDVAVGFAERRLRLQHLRIDQALDDDLGLGRHQEIDGLRPHHVDGAAGERAGDGELVEILRHLLHRGVGDRRRAADDDGARQRLAARLAFLPVGIDARAQLDRRIHPEPARRLELSAIVADVLDAGLGVLGDVMAGGEIRRVVPAGRRDRHRQAVERGAVAIEVVAGDDHLLARRIRHHARRQGRGDRLDPGRPDLLERPAEADAVDLAVRRQPGNQHGDVEAAALGIRRLREQEGLALRLWDAAAILPAHQRVHLGVFVDRLVDHDEQARARQRQHVLVQVGIAARMLGRPVAVARERAQCALRSSIVHRRLRQHAQSSAVHSRTKP